MEALFSDNKHVLVFKTNLHYKDIKNIEPVLNAEARIICWNVDLTDIDNVLRIESVGPHTQDVIAMLTKEGYQCEELMD
jgi:tRNA G26 N,N-dimethylase Trm1